MPLHRRSMKYIDNHAKNIIGDFVEIFPKARFYAVYRTSDSVNISDISDAGMNDFLTVWVHIRVVAWRDIVVAVPQYYRLNLTLFRASDQ